MSLETLVFLATAIATVASQATVQVNTPTSVVACLPVQFSWQGGTGPYFLSIIPGGQPTALPLEDLGQQTGTNFVWKADIAAGTALTVQIRDSQGQLNYSDQFTVQPGSSTCSPSGTVTSGTVAATPKPGTSTTSTNPAVSTGTSKSNTTTPKTGSNSTAGTGSTGTTGTTGTSTGTTNTTSTNPSTASTGAQGGDATRASASFAAVAMAVVVAIFA